MPQKTIAVDLDDTLNNFSETLRTAEFARDPAEALPEDRFQQYLNRVRAAAADTGELLSTEFTYFRARIHLRCFALAQPHPEGAAFMRWLREEGWRIVICTGRDLRRAHAGTQEWLRRHGVPYDHLFMAGNKIVFCALWGIRHLVDDDLFNIAHGAKYDVQVYYPELAKHAGVDSAGARPFRSFEELKPWLTASAS